jgi:hypothetical protein
MNLLFKNLLLNLPFFIFCKKKFSKNLVFLTDTVADLAVRYTLYGRYTLCAHCMHLCFIQPCASCFGCVHIHYLGKWEGVGPGNLPLALVMDMHASKTLCTGLDHRCKNSHNYNI